MSLIVVANASTYASKYHSMGCLVIDDGFSLCHKMTSTKPLKMTAAPIRPVGAPGNL